MHVQYLIDINRFVRLGQLHDVGTCFAESLHTFSWVCAFWMAMPEKSANASTVDLFWSVNDLPSTCKGIDLFYCQIVQSDFRFVVLTLFMNCTTPTTSERRL